MEDPLKPPREVAQEGPLKPLLGVLVEDPLKIPQEIAEEDPLKVPRGVPMKDPLKTPRGVPMEDPLKTPQGIAEEDPLKIPIWTTCGRPPGRTPREAADKDPLKTPARSTCKRPPELATCCVSKNRPPGRHFVEAPLWVNSREAALNPPPTKRAPSCCKTKDILCRSAPTKLFFSPPANAQSSLLESISHLSPIRRLLAPVLKRLGQGLNVHVVLRCSRSYFFDDSSIGSQSRKNVGAREI